MAMENSSNKKKEGYQIKDIFDLIFLLDSMNVQYYLGSYSPDTIAVHFAFADERIEINCYQSGRFDIAYFKGEEVMDIEIDDFIENFVYPKL